MKPILTPAESGILDRESQARGIPAERLMENAGREVARAAAGLAGGLYGRRALVICGKGNNGGDGLVAARHLSGWGMRVTVAMLEPGADLREPAALNFRRLAHTDLRVRPFSAALIERELDRSDVAVDAIFGTGFRGFPEDEYALAIGALNGSAVPVVAVDIPSGVNGETAAVEGDAVWAGMTVTFGALKPGVVLLPGAERAGVVEVADIGFPPDLVKSDLWLMEEADVAAVLPAREPETHKREAGYAVIVGGSRPMTGAVCLAAEAAYRAGAGLVTVAVPEGILAVVEARLTETTFLPLPETVDGTVAPAALDRVMERLQGADAVAVGPGMTTNQETASFIRDLVRTSPAPVVVDADGLNAYAGRAAEFAERRAEAVLTPHAGEFGRLAGLASRDVIQDRVGHARKLAAETQAVVLLKGTRTIVASPDGKARVNPTGGPVLATGGTGDVLTGVVTGLLARGVPIADAAASGAFVHGLAGSLAGISTGEGTVAGDVLAHVPEAMRRVRGE